VNRETRLLAETTSKPVLFLKNGFLTTAEVTGHTGAAAMPQKPGFLEETRF
jgi:hypothetical protein